MELYQLRYAVAVADTGNFTRAAERCNVTQPSLSQQIINLEKEVGHKLFHRLGRRAVLTEAGAVFIERARQIVYDVENAAKELSDHPSLDRRITVGAIQTVAPYLLLPMIEVCKRELPNLQINLIEDFRVDLVHGVVEGDLDLAIVTLPVDDPRVSVEPLMTEPLLLVVGKNHPFATRKEISINDLADETFVTMGESSTLAAQIRSFFGGHNFQPKVGYRCAQVATLKTLVAMGLAISILPRVDQEEKDRETLTYLRLTGSAPTRELVVVRHLQRYQSRGAQQFLQLLHEQVRLKQQEPSLE
ncbi:LysR family transcriptional regulator [Opitutus terrae]|uniref:Transcriptional regulator, LysR family n=1 Tax=Opitutus terrae (strain DSM 11246 / JCM 15787 / PB90-1) TaxID=452637 RepID=B1ZUQ0_OPITP|nr:LysR family transcriptional regulator [Opitutus terrae]ACB74934.1 transcriptional regulator, LysR family [Opitutus terrae PB90-1]